MDTKIHPLLEKLRADHQNISMLLGIIEQETNAINSGRTPDYSLMADIMRYMVIYSDTQHHPLEDIIFQKLLHKDQESVEMVEELLEDHLKITQREEVFANVLTDLSKGASGVQQDLIEPMLEYLDLMREHTNKKELSLMLRVSSTFTHEDWEDVQHEMENGKLPIFEELVGHQHLSISGRVAEILASTQQ